jgi:hypothetical protein
MQGIVWSRWISSVTVFQPIIDNNPVQNVIGARVALLVDFNEFSPQATPVPLQDINIDVNRASDGQILVEANYQYP